jgi:hypothetical protein
MVGVETSTPAVSVYSLAHLRLVESLMPSSPRILTILDSWFDANPTVTLAA